MNKERNCQKCIHHISGLCSKWNCEMQTLEDYRNKVIDEFAEKFIYKAVCEGCSGCCDCYENEYQMACEDWKYYMGIAEQMKAGVKNE